ncbi:MAG: TetR family transcriptional regulator [Myxococcales bacterium]|nr:TetR family transcriptional regulator [Myxococcales bacterium]
MSSRVRSLRLPSVDEPERTARLASARDRLLDAAEALFAERGYAGTSMRAVTQAAGLSVSAANYHFGSKPELLRAVCARALAPLEAARNAAFDALEARTRATGCAPSVEDVVRAFVAPAAAPSDALRAGSRSVAARLFADPPDVVVALKEQLFGETSRRAMAALARALPECGERDVALAFQLMVGSFVHVVSGQLDVAPGLAAPLPRDAALGEALVRYCAAGIRAAVVPCAPDRAGANEHAPALEGAR